MALEERRARTLLERLDHPEPPAHPVEALLAIQAESMEWQVILRERLAELTTLETTDTLGTERERAVVLLYEKSLERNARLLVEMSKLDLQARALKLKQDDAKRVMAAIRSALVACGLGEHEAEFRQKLAEHIAGIGSDDDE